MGRPLRLRQTQTARFRMIPRNATKNKNTSPVLVFCISPIVIYFRSEVALR
jgi:hypothetical protein